MNDGLYNGFGSSFRGYMRPAVWQIYETTVANVPFRTDAKFVSFLVIGGGGGGGGGRFGSATAASGGGGGGGSGVILLRRMNVNICAAMGLQFFDCTIGAGGTAGTGATVDATDGTSGTAGGTTTLTFKLRHPVADEPLYLSSPFAAGQGAQGVGGSTTGGNGGSGGASPMAGFAGTAGSNSNNSFASYAYTQFGTVTFPISNGSSGGNAGLWKGLRGDAGIHFGQAFGPASVAINRGTLSADGIHADFATAAMQSELFSLPYMPDVLEFRNYLPGGGGAGNGGNTTTNTRGGDGGNGWRGSGGGGGGGASGVRGGNGGSGGKGCVIICWEYQ